MNSTDIVTLLSAIIVIGVGLFFEGRAQTRALFAVFVIAVIIGIARCSG
jgi:hypothetical protein